MGTMQSEIVLLLMWAEKNIQKKELLHQSNCKITKKRLSNIFGMTAIKNIFKKSTIFTVSYFQCVKEKYILYSLDKK